MANVSRREVLLILTPVLVVVGLFGIQLAQSIRENTYRSQCRGRLAELGRAFALYEQDNNSRLPPVKSNPGGARQGTNLTGRPINAGWADTLSIECKIPFNMFVCYGNKLPSTNAGFAPQKSGFTDYWMNRQLSGLSKAQIVAPDSTLLLGEGNNGHDVSDATYSKTSLPPAWVNDANSPAHRHSGGANYLMADGTVHWIKPSDVATFGGRKNAFAIR